MTSYLIFDKTSNAANFNATIFGTSGARLAQPSGATRQALEVVNLGTSNALRVRSGAQHNAIVVGPSGNVGLGTATPVTPLHIHATTYVSGGNVGIGTTAPIANLHVQGDTQLTGILSAGELRPNGLIAWLPFAGHLFDLSGSNIIGAPTIGSASATPSAATATTTAVNYNPNGREGTSLVGVNPPGGAAATYVTYPIITAATALPSPTAPAGFAVTAWVRPYATATTGNRQFFFGTDGGYGATTVAGASILAIGLEPTTNYPVVLLQPSQGSYVTLTAPVVIPLNAWTHFTVTLSGTAASPNNTLTLYINGTAQGTVQSYTHATAAPAYLANLLLFNGFTGATNAFHGELDTVQVYQRPLTLAEIAAASTASSEKTPAIQAHSVRITGALQLSDATTLDVTPSNSSNAASTLQVTTSDYQMRDMTGNIASVPDVTNGKVIPVPFGPFANSPNEGSIFLDNSVTNPGSNGAYLSSLNSNAYGFNWWQNGGFTVETWVNFKTLNNLNNTYICGNMNTNDVGDYWSLRINNSGIFRFRYWNGAGVIVDGVSTLSTNTWYHLAVTCDAGSPNNIRMFVNGSLETTATVSGTPIIDTTIPFAIGQFSSGLNVNGYVANTRLVRGAALYTATFTPPTAPLGPATSGITALLLRAAKFQRTPLQLTSDGRLSVAKITATDPSISSQAYPPAAFTGHVTNITTSTYGNGYYIVSASSEFSTSLQAWRLFDRTGTQWASISAAAYNTSTPYSYNGTITTIDTNGISYSGEWAQIQLPLSISLTAYTITGSSGQPIKFPARFYILGSINGVNWTLVSQQSAIPYSASPQLFTVNTTRAFTYYRIVVNQITGNGTLVDFSEWLLYGKPESLNITSDGRLGVGVVNPTQALEVAGNAVFGGNVNVGGIIGDQSLQISPYVTFDGTTTNRDLFLTWMQYVTSLRYRYNFGPTALRKNVWWNTSQSVDIYDSLTYSTIAIGSLVANAYYGSVLIPDGRVVFVPHGATAGFGIFNPSTNSYSTISMSPSPPTYAYSGGVLLPDGRIVFVPANTTTIGLFNPATNTYSTILVGAPGSNAYQGGVLLPDGRVLFVPNNATTIGLFNPTTNTYSTILGAPGSAAYIGGVLLPDGRVVFVPQYATTIGLFNSVTNTYTTILGAPGTGAYYGGVLLPDGRVVFVPTSATTIGIFNPATNTFSTILGLPGSAAYIGGVLLPDGRVIFAPHNTTTIGLFNPVTNTYSTIATTLSANTGAYLGCTLLPDGRVVFVPLNVSTIGILTTSQKSRPPPPELCYHPCFNKF